MMSNNNHNSQLIKKTLEAIYLGDMKQNIIEAELLTALSIHENRLNLVIEFPEELVIDQASVIDQINALLASQFRDIRIIFSSKKTAKSPTKTQHSIPNVKKIILFAAAKGGVGKSTTATNVALALAQSGKSVGIVDADIYGPTIPKLLNIQQKPEIADGKMLPIHKHGIYSMSIGYLIDDNQAAIWRGPMISKTLYQLLLGVKWPELDYLIVDMPPGTGDIYLSLAENFVIDGVVLLTTPQHIALNMLKKSLSFFSKTNIPIIGIVENMSYFFDADNNVTHHIFGDNLTEETAHKMGTRLLGQIGLIPKISKLSDQGITLVAEEEFKMYQKIAKQL